jgi:hypothetical protein
MVLASDFDKSKYLRAEDLKSEKKFRIKSWTVEVLGTGKDKEKKLVVWFTNDERGLVLNKTNNRTLGACLATTCVAGPARSSSCFLRWSRCRAK